MITGKSQYFNMNGLNSVPFVGDIVDSWSSTYNVILIQKEIVNYEVVETEIPLTFQGMVQNGAGSRMDIKDIGIREWDSYQLWSTFQFKNDDIIVVNGIRFRIMATDSWNTTYGYYHYDLKEDYLENVGGEENNG